MEKVTVSASKTYDIVIEQGLLDSVGTYCQALFGGRKALLLSDSNVAPLYGARVAASLEKSGFEVHSYTVNAGEASKNADNMLAIVNFMEERGFTRADTLVALGGGVVGDLGGVCAACFLRGIGFVQVPTTLLACVDSSVGGKTAVNLAAGKNLFGVFYQPDIVICDPDTLLSLKKETFAEGMAEVIKYGMIWDAALFAKLEAGDMDIADIIKRCVSIKSEVVAVDERDHGLRQILNFGHTVGHAIEKLSGFAVSHGAAVAQGMAIVCRSLVKKGAVEAVCAERLEKLLEKTGLESRCGYAAKELAGCAMADKKRRADTLTLVTVTAIGKYKLTDIPAAELEAFVEAGL